MIAAGVAVILFLVSLIMSYKTWRWHTMLMLFLVLCAAGTFYGMSMELLRIHSVWREPYNKLTEQIAQEQQRIRDLKEGVFLEDGKRDPGFPTVSELEVEVREAVVERGRNWTGVKPQGDAGGDGTVTVQIDTPFPAQIKQEMLLYAFSTSQDLPTISDLEVAEGEVPLGPYLGIFRVTNVQEFTEDGAPVGEDPAAPEEAEAPADPLGGGPEPVAGEGEEEAAPEPIASSGRTMVTLQPEWRATGLELGRIAAAVGPDATWALYEKMPVDNRFFFAELDDAIIDKLFPEGVEEEFIRDLEPAAEDDPPAQTYVEVKFLKEYTLPNVSTELYPDEPTEEPQVMKPGDTAWLAEATVVTPQGTEIPGATDLAEQGIVKPVEDTQPRFERDLRDYDAIFQADYVARARLREEIASITRKIAINRATAEAANVELERLQETARRYQIDKAGFDRELAALNKHLAELDSRYRQTLAEMKQGFIENQQMANQIERIQLSAAAAINRRLQEQATETTSQ